jgi:hypothetical protein
MVYIKFRTEGWIEVDEEYHNLHGITLEHMAYEMTEGNGICTLFKEIKRTEKHEELDGGAEGFFDAPFEDDE